MTNTMNTRTGLGDVKVAADLYASAILSESSIMRRAGVYVCLANLLNRMPGYNPQILSDVFWTLARAGQIS